MLTEDLIENTVAILHIHVVRHGSPTNTDLEYGRTATLENFWTDPANGVANSLGTFFL